MSYTTPADGDTEKNISYHQTADIEVIENQRSLANSSGSHSTHKEGRSLSSSRRRTKGQDQRQLHPGFNRLTSNSGIHQHLAIWKYPAKSRLECGT